MNKFVLMLLIGVIVIENLNLAEAKEVQLTSKNFQKDFLQKVSETMKSTAMDYLNNYLKGIKKPAHVHEDFNAELKMALESSRLEPKVVFIKQYLDMLENKDTNRENIYGLKNVMFLKKLKDKFYNLQEESFEEIHQLRYYYLCKQFKVQKEATTPLYHNYYSKSTQLVPINEHNVGSMLHRLGVKDNHTISINISDFGKELYQKVNDAGCDVIDDYLIILRKLLQEVLEPESEEEPTAHSESLRKILIEINAQLKITDFYTKRQRLYDYLQNNLALDYEQFQSSETSQHDLMAVFNKLKEKGLDLVVAFLFSNFEFVDHLQHEWQELLPQAPISLYDAHSRPLKEIQQLYAEFKQDFENSSKYDSYLEAVKLLHEQTQRDNADNTHIYEMLYSASQNVGSSRATLMNSKCNEI
ncbi:hypothetical protein FF38_04084 [Lucilia cuprina]|uniref:Uncharacterized protein n=1 Tax=Lucilia cuprina TaxID=7375 RepID=A0A0L0BRV8_LUCCU|nr:hypothetical protein FF38_04084 [Lucilia cuprina]